METGDRSALLPTPFGGFVPSHSGLYDAGNVPFWPNYPANMLETAAMLSTLCPDLLAALNSRAQGGVDLNQMVTSASQLRHFQEQLMQLNPSVEDDVGRFTGMLSMAPRSTDRSHSPGNSMRRKSRSHRPAGSKRITSRRPSESTTIKASSSWSRKIPSDKSSENSRISAPRSW